MNKTLLYVAEDGSYGDATGLTLVDATGFDSDDYDDIDNGSDNKRARIAVRLAKEYGNDPLVWAWFTKKEATQMFDSLEAAIVLLVTRGDMGLAEQIGDIRDVLNRTGVTS
jgi:hypothetical protein